jgi:hypothetical protein
LLVDVGWIAFDVPPRSPATWHPSWAGKLEGRPHISIALHPLGFFFKDVTEKNKEHKALRQSKADKFLKEPVCN